MDLTKIYTSIEDLPLYNFDKIDTTGDLMWLYEDFNGRQPKTDVTTLKPVYDEIFNEFFVALSDPETEMRIQKESRIQVLISKHDTVSMLIHRVAMGFEGDVKSQQMRKEFISRLLEYRYKIVETENDFNTHYDDLIACQKIAASLESVKTQITLIENQLKQYKNTQSVKMQRQVFIVSKHLFNGVPIKPKEVSVAWWVEALKDLKQLQESQNTNNGR